MKENAVNCFLNQGYSCSEAVVKSAVDSGLVGENLVPVATPFSGGMGSGCLCGAVAGMQLIIGARKGRHSGSESADAKTLAQEAVAKFKERNKFTCCKVLKAGFEMHSPERKQHCAKMVKDAAEILTEMFETAYHG